MRPIQTIVIVGLGLMGGSLAAACRKAYPGARIFGVSRRRSALQYAQRKHWVHKTFTDLKKAAPEADLIVLCTPVRTFASQLRTADAVVRPGTLVTDVGSVKGDVNREVRLARPKHLLFVGSHPLVGSHLRGVQAASAGLYRGGLVFVVPSGSGKSTSYHAVARFWKKLGMKVVPVSAGNHDRIVAEISHLPHAVAVNLVLSAGPSCLKFAGAGFRDSTRVAAGDPSIWTPIFLANRKAFLQVLQDFEASLARFRDRVRRGDARGIEKMLSEAALKRREI